MASLKETSELAWRQLFPNPGDETSITREEFAATAKLEYAWQTQLWYWNEKQREGEVVMPSHLLTEKEMDVVNNAIDISKLNIFRNLSGDIWLQNVGGLQCKCKYVKSDVNLSQLLCDDDSLDDNAFTYYVTGKKIVFPKGTHTKKLPIIYADKGDEIDDDVEIDEGIAGIVRSRLIDIYAGKVGKEDTTNNTNSEK